MTSAKKRIRQRIRDAETAAPAERQIVNEALRGAMPYIETAAAAIQKTVTDILRHRPFLPAPLLCRHIVNGVGIRVGPQPRESIRKTPFSRDLEGVIIADSRCISISRIHDVGKYVPQRTTRLRSSGA